MHPVCIGSHVGRTWVDSVGGGEMTSKKWTDADDNLLRKMYERKISPSEAALQFGRTTSAIYMRATRLGLRLEPAPDHNHPSWKLIQRACEDGKPRTVAQLAAAVGLTHEGVGYILRKRRNEGQAHVVSYEKVYGFYRAHWLPLPGEDVEPPGINVGYSDERRRAARKRAAKRTAAVAAVPVPVVVPEQHEIMKAFYGLGASA